MQIHYYNSEIDHIVKLNYEGNCQEGKLTDNDEKQREHVRRKQKSCILSWLCLEQFFFQIHHTVFKKYRLQLYEYLK